MSENGNTADNEQKKISRLLTIISKKLIKKKLNKEAELKINLYNLDITVKGGMELTASLSVIMEDRTLKELVSDTKVPAFLVDFSGIVSNLGIVKRKAGNKVAELIKNKTGAETEVVFDELKKAKKNDLDRIFVSLKITADEAEASKLVHALIPEKYGIDVTDPGNIALSIKNDKVDFKIKSALTF